MLFLRILIGTILISMIGYTLIVVSAYGPNFFPAFFSDLFALTWSGQINFDFMWFLTLTALWVSWRNHFTVKGLGLAVVAGFGGMLFLATYLLILTFTSEGRVDNLLLGKKRAAELGGLTVG
jgi:hypothetical protein